MNVPHEQSAGLIAMPDVRHAFFGRQGGLSTGIFAGLNTSDAGGDDPSIVADNRKMVMATLGFEPHQLALVKQVHSNKAVTITGPHSGPRIEADALVTNRRGIALGILTADCTPILFADPEAGIVGAAHAGWRGAVDGVIGNTVAAMTALGAVPARIAAAIGPTVTAPNYEVGPQFMADFLALHPGGAHYFTTPTGGREHFNLPAFVADQLAAAGIRTIDRVGGCTYGNPGRYFSHRHATHQGTTTGRQIAVIALT
ncbi:laccase domain protein [Devosia yakushimensis]|uniref:Purine nucleoside phosphorylase n=1 Tax=Devosia yakushimensis TaxID=470028 RepID=A0ABQ5U8Z4_9HYPH|nr:peptidoglycan editing factor PgeF [Devosia yakushimensis]GLQ08602.1 laccase domain protein [Devosia yakushimensis]